MRYYIMDYILDLYNKKEQESEKTIEGFCDFFSEFFKNNTPKYFSVIPGNDNRNVNCVIFQNGLELAFTKDFKEKINMVSPSVSITQNNQGADNVINDNYINFFKGN